MDEAQAITQQQSSEFIKMEVAQIHQTIRSYDSHRWQLATFLGGLNITLVALGLSLQSYGIVLFSSVLLVLVLLGDLMLKATLAIPLYRALKLEPFYTDDNTSYFRLYIGAHTNDRHRDKFLAEMDEIIEYTDIDVVARRLRRLFMRPFRIRTGVARIVVIGLAIEIALGIYLKYLQWGAFPTS